MQAATVSQFSFAIVPSLSWQMIDFMVEHLQEKGKSEGEKAGRCSDPHLGRRELRVQYIALINPRMHDRVGRKASVNNLVARRRRSA